MAERGAPWLLSLLCLTFLHNTGAKHVDKGSAEHPFSPFWFTVEPQDTLAVRGSPALLNCSAHSDASTPARVEWKKDGTFMSLGSDERRHVLPDGSLFFNQVVHSKHNKPDEGTYQCVATIDNLGSISSRTARLSVAVFQKLRKGTTVTEGERLTLPWRRTNPCHVSISIHLHLCLCSYSQ
uniref:Ig-like domain-containing protein n=1 Tax=Gouania willdenowi TaxID=441366 RepID=A0A8C5N5K5_GOUWI